MLKMMIAASLLAMPGIAPAFGACRDARGKFAKCGAAGARPA